MRSPSTHVQKLLGREGGTRINVTNREGNFVILPIHRAAVDRSRPKVSDNVFAVPALDRTDESNRRRGKLRDVVL